MSEFRVAVQRLLNKLDMIGGHMAANWKEEYAGVKKLHAQAAAPGGKEPLGEQFDTVDDYLEGRASHPLQDKPPVSFEDAVERTATRNAERGKQYQAPVEALEVAHVLQDKPPAAPSNLGESILVRLRDMSVRTLNLCTGHEAKLICQAMIDQIVIELEVLKEAELAAQDKPPATPEDGGRAT